MYCMPSSYTRCELGDKQLASLIPGQDEGGLQLGVCKEERTMKEKHQSKAYCYNMPL